MEGASCCHSISNKTQSRCELNGSFNGVNSGAIIRKLLFLNYKKMPLPDKFTVAGSPEQVALILPILEAMYLGFKELEVNGGGGTSRPLPNDVVGKIFIRLSFKGRVRSTTRIHRIEKSFRLMHDDPRTIAKEKIKYYGERIKEKFDNFTFVTGHETYTYNDPVNGFNRIWGHFLDQANGMRLYEQMLDIISQSPNWKRLYKSVVVEPGDRFQEPPEKVMQANISIRTQRERPVADMKFYRAIIKFPHVPDELLLVDEHLGVYDPVSLLSKYED